MIIAVIIMDITDLESSSLQPLIVPHAATAVCGELATTQTRLEQLRVKYCTLLTRKQQLIE